MSGTATALSQYCTHSSQQLGWATVNDCVEKFLHYAATSATPFCTRLQHCILHGVPLRQLLLCSNHTLLHKVSSIQPRRSLPSRSAFTSVADVLYNKSLYDLHTPLKLAAYEVCIFTLYSCPCQHQLAAVTAQQQTKHRNTVEVSVPMPKLLQLMLACSTC